MSCSCWSAIRPSAASRRRRRRSWSTRWGSGAEAGAGRAAMTDPRPPGQAPDDSRRLRVQNDALARLAEQYWQEMWRLRGERDELLGSRSFRVGQAIAEALRQPWRLPGLPWRLWRIARGAGQVAGLADRVPVPSLRLPAAGAERSFRLAAVVDEFTALGLQGECELLLVTPDTSAEELRDFRPDLL